jgi:hypothetical protein
VRIVIGVMTSILGLLDRACMRLATLALLALALAPATAGAADPTAHQYSSNLEQLSAGGAGGAGGSSAGSESVGGGLPFTGLDLVALAAVAAALVVAGLLLRRRRADSVEG